MTTISGSAGDECYDEEATSGTEGLSEDVALRQGLMRWAWTSERFLFSPDSQAFVNELLDGKR